MPDSISSLLGPWLFFLAGDPILRAVQGGLLLLGGIVLFLIFFTLRDILLRTESLSLQILSLLLVTVLPGVGFLLYLLIRPARTIKERELEALLRRSLPKKHPPPKK